MLETCAVAKKSRKRENTFYGVIIWVIGPFRGGALRSREKFELLCGVFVKKLARSGAAGRQGPWLFHPPPLADTLRYVQSFLCSREAQNFRPGSSGPGPEEQGPALLKILVFYVVPILSTTIASLSRQHVDAKKWGFPSERCCTVSGRISMIGARVDSARSL